MAPAARSVSGHRRWVTNAAVASSAETTTAAIAASGRTGGRRRGRWRRPNDASHRGSGVSAWARVRVELHAWPITRCEDCRPSTPCSATSAPPTSSRATGGRPPSRLSGRRSPMPAGEASPRLPRSSSRGPSGSSTERRACARRSTPPASSCTRTWAGRRCRPRRCGGSREVAGGYSNLELDLDAGVRGSRHSHLGPLLRRADGRRGRPGRQQQRRRGAARPGGPRRRAATCRSAAAS